MTVKQNGSSLPEKIPAMQKSEYDDLVRSGTVARIAFSGSAYPYIAPFMYVFDEKNMYFLSTRYGRKMRLFAENPVVCVEVEEIAPDMSSYRFVTMQGNLVEVTESAKKREIRKLFADRILQKKISPKSLAALGHNPSDDPMRIAEDDRTMVWKLTGVRDIVALKDS